MAAQLATAVHTAPPPVVVPPGGTYQVPLHMLQSVGPEGSQQFWQVLAESVTSVQQSSLSFAFPLGGSILRLGRKELELRRSLGLALETRTVGGSFQKDSSRTTLQRYSLLLLPGLRVANSLPVSLRASLHRGETPSSGVAMGSAGAAEERALTAYGQLWALYVLCPFFDRLLLGVAGAVDARPLGPGDAVLLPLAALAALLEGRLALGMMLLAHIVKLAMFAHRLPFVWDHECWAAATEVSFVLAAAQGETGVVQRFWPAARAQLLLLYAGAAFWKLNTSFLDHRTSCGTVILAQVWAAYMPSTLALDLAPMVTRLAPFAALGGEVMLPLAMACFPRLGVFLALLFHLLVVLAPAPNFAGGFSVTCASRLILCLPWEAASALGHISLAVLGAALAVAFVRSAAFATFALMFLVTVSAVLASGLQKGSNAGSSAALTRCSAVGTFVYAFVLPVLGLQHMASCSMYANLKHYGGSNHLLMPTGLLQDAFPVTFGSELLRVDKAAGLLAAQNVWTEIEPELATTLLRAANHSGRQFVPYYARMGSLEDAGVALQEENAALPVVMSAFELRRSLAVLRRSGQTASLSYVRLPGDLQTPAEWLAHRGAAVRVHPNGTCTVDTRPCAEDEIALQPPPPRWLTSMLLPYPYALLPGDGKEIHCSS
ncbi:unnamed protein product [Symbiodinium microadriaticum]|nr:unnamed protein product [Symbiodinium microadriaticum]